MASFQAIAATGQAIIRLLADSRPQPEFSTTRFELYQLGDFSDPMEEGISFFLYRVAVNGTRRNIPPTVGPDGIRHRPPLPLDLHYVASVWAKSPVKQQRLLGWMIRQLEDVPILPTGLLNQSGPEPDVFRPNETVELILEPMDDDAVLMRVHDTGAGIPPEQLPRIFEKFYQADNQRSARAAGSGLGLAIAKQIVEAHGGSILCESTPGVGTTFSIALPTRVTGRHTSQRPLPVPV